MLKAIMIRERGAAPRGMARVFGRCQAEAWEETGLLWHERFRDERFTEEHARKAGYVRRKGEAMPRESKGFRRSYTGRKLARFGHTRPLEWSGETRLLVAAMPNIRATRKAARVSYPGARKLNFRHPKSQVRAAEEFRRIIPEEIPVLADRFDERLDELVNDDQSLQQIQVN